jgi:hypothetical protein
MHYLQIDSVLKVLFNPVQYPSLERAGDQPIEEEQIN